MWNNLTQAHESCRDQNYHFEFSYALHAICSLSNRLCHDDENIARMMYALAVQMFSKLKQPSELTLFKSFLQTRNFTPPREPEGLQKLS